MKPLAFLRTEEALRLLERASQAAGMPLAVHYVDGAREGARTVGFSACGLCQHVQKAPGGAVACRASRGTASAMALRQQRAIPFVCHLGLGCLCVPLLDGETFVLTLGPYCPAGETNALERDALAGWQALHEDDALLPLPVTLDDVHRVPEGVPEAVAAWTVEALNALWRAALQAEEAPQETEAPAENAPQRIAMENLAGSWAASVAAALAGGDQPRARALVRGVLEEDAAQTKKGQTGVRRARALSATAEILAALEHTGLAIDRTWAALPGFAQKLHHATTADALLTAMMDVLAVARRQAAPREGGQSALPDYPELYALLADRVHESPTLAEVAQILGESPSAISHRLKRKFGLSFSEYLARLRIDHAKDLLRRTALTATEVARRVGVRDQSHFSKLFKKFEGLSPLEYRNTYGKKK